MTMADNCVLWAQKSVNPTDHAEDLMYEYAEEHLDHQPECVDQYDTGRERRWDKEQEMVFKFEDDSLVIVSFWTALQNDHSDGIEPDTTWYVGRAQQVTVTKYIRATA